MIRGEEQRGARDLVGMRVPVQRDRFVEHGGGVAPHQAADAVLDVELELIVDRTRMQRVDADVAARGALGV